MTSALAGGLHSFAIQRHPLHLYEQMCCLDDAYDALLTLADDALFVSKRAGGNAVSVWEPPAEAEEPTDAIK